MDLFVIGDDGEMCLLDVPDGCSDLVGFESWRRTGRVNPAPSSIPVTVRRPVGAIMPVTRAQNVPKDGPVCGTLRATPTHPAKSAKVEQ